METHYFPNKFNLNVVTNLRCAYKTNVRFARKLFKEASISLKKLLLLFDFKHSHLMSPSRFRKRNVFLQLAFTAASPYLLQSEPHCPKFTLTT